jgi:hypothetical protein
VLAVRFTMSVMPVGVISSAFLFLDSLLVLGAHTVAPGSG